LRNFIKGVGVPTSQSHWMGSMDVDQTSMMRFIKSHANGDLWILWNKNDSRYESASPFKQVHIGKHIVFRLRPDTLCTIGALNKNHAKPHRPSLKSTILCIEFKNYHGRYPKNHNKKKHTKYDPLMNILKDKGWRWPAWSPLQSFRGAIHKLVIEKLSN
jgi:hypothetical protein